jgi:hypothetical protein
MKTKDTPDGSDGDFYVRSGPGTVKLSTEDSKRFIQTRFKTLKLQPKTAQ